jgi:hypothetical protein
MPCEFSLRLVPGLAAGERWRFVRAAQQAVEDAGGLWEGELAAGVALFQGVTAEWRLEGERTFLVSVDPPEACQQVERLVRSRASAWLERSDSGSVAGLAAATPVADVVVAPGRQLPWWGWALIAVGVVGALGGVFAMTSPRRRRR